MAYKCPRCSAEVSRGTSRGVTAAAGLVGALFYMAFGAFRCPKCGKIPRSEFSSDDRAKMTRGTLILIVVAVALAVGVIALLANWH